MENKNIESLLLDQANHLLNQINSLIEQLKNILGDDINLPNIGITYNNKLVEIFNIFNNNNVEFEQSELRIIIYHQLTSIIDDSISYLSNYVTSIEKIINLKNKIPNKESFVNKLLFKNIYNEIDELIITCEELLNLYQEKDNELFHYDLGKDIRNYIINHPEVLYEIDSSMSKEEIIHNCNIDLRSLGLKEQIELSNIEVDSYLDKYTNSINTDFDIYDLISNLIDKIKEEYQDYPFVKHSIEEYLLDYLEDAITAYKNGDWEIYDLIKEKILSFDIDTYIVEIIGKRIGFCQYLDSKELELDNTDYKSELQQLNYQSIIPIIEEEANNKKYYEYGKRQYHNLINKQ